MGTYRALADYIRIHHLQNYGLLKGATWSSQPGGRQNVEPKSRRPFPYQNGAYLIDPLCHRVSSGHTKLEEILRCKTAEIHAVHCRLL